MDTLDRSQNEKYVIKVFARLLALASVIYGAILIYGAVNLSHTAVPASFEGDIGPLRLFIMTLAPVVDGRQASLSFLAGSLVYFVVWVGLGILLAWRRLSSRQLDQIN